MSAIRYAVNKVLQRINKDVLNLAFIRRSEFYGVNVSLAKQIEDIIIHPIVRVDCDMHGGREVIIPLSKCVITYLKKNDDEVNIVINVPAKVIDGKKVLEPINVMNNVGSGEYDYNNSINDKTDSLSYITKGKANMWMTANLELIGTNTILVKENIDNIYNGSLRVNIANDKNVRNIKTNTYPLFAKLVVLATKHYVYETLSIELEKGYLVSGLEASKITDKIESYAGTDEEYDELLEDKWGKVSFMNDQTAMHSFIKTMIGNNF